jgi:hypothetical protein
MLDPYRLLYPIGLTWALIGTGLRPLPSLISVPRAKLPAT